MLTKKYAVDTVLDGKIALEMIKAYHYDIILCDINLPGMNGRELLPEFNKLSPESAIIMMTGNPDLKDAVELMKTGAMDYLTKPIEIERLYSCIGKVFEKKTQ